MVRHQKGTREMRTEDELWWLDIELIGFEDGDDDGDEDTEDSEDEDENSEDEEDNSSDDDDDSEDDDEEKPDVKGLKSALAKERAERRRLQKENKALKRSQPAKKAATKPGDNEEEDDSSKPDEEAQRRNERLAGKLLTNAVNTEIIKAAGSRFTDIDDVLALINRNEIDAEQDDDDPSEVIVDRESVKEAIKQLARKKPHLVASEKSNGTQTGSKFGGRKKSGNTMSEEQLKDKYPALRDR